MDQPRKLSRHEYVGLWAGICGILIGGLALVLSYHANEIAKEANQIAHEQASAQLGVLDMSGFSFTQTERSDLAVNLWVCRFAIQVANLGGSASAIVSYDAEFFFKDHKVTVLESGSPMSGSPMIWRNTEELVPFTSLEAFFSRNGKFDDVPTQDETRMQRLAEVVEPKTARVFYIAGIVGSPTNTTYTFESFERDDFRSTQYDPTKLTGYSPVEIDFVFKTPNEEVIRSPRKPCIFVKP